MNNLLQKLLIAMTAAYVALLPQFYLVFDVSNRFSLFWDRTQHLAILLSITILGMIFFGAYAAAYRLLKPSGLLRRGCDIAFVWLLCFVLIRSFIALFDRGNLLPDSVQAILDQRNTKILYYVVVPLGLILFQTARTKAVMTKLYCILSPLLAHVLIVPLAYPTFDVFEAQLPDELFNAQTGTAKELPDIYIFMFDDWSYARTFPDGSLWDELPHLKAFSSQATIYHQAYSPGAETIVSIPRFLFQTDPELRGKDFDALTHIINTRQPMHFASIFDAADDWLTLAIGFYFDHQHLLGHAVDYPLLVVNTAEWGLRARIGYYLTTQFTWARHFGFQVVPRELTMNQKFLSAQQLIHPLAMKVIKEINAPVFAFFHYCLPHAPYVWDRHGLNDRYDPNQWTKHTEENYLSNLRYLDTVIGEIVQGLTERGRYDNALIIFTSDHSWKWDPAEEHYNVAARPLSLPHHVDTKPFSYFKHTVLLIKEPLQTEEAHMYDPLILWDIYPIIERSLGIPGEGKPNR